MEFYKLIHIKIQEQDTTIKLVLQKLAIKFKITELTQKNFTKKR